MRSDAVEITLQCWAVMSVLCAIKCLLISNDVIKRSGVLQCIYTDYERKYSANTLAKTDAL